MLTQTNIQNEALRAMLAPSMHPGSMGGLSMHMQSAGNGMSQPMQTFGLNGFPPVHPLQHMPGAFGDRTSALGVSASALPVAKSGGAGRGGGWSNSMLQLVSIGGTRDAVTHGASHRLQLVLAGRQRDEDEEDGEDRLQEKLEKIVKEKQTIQKKPSTGGVRKQSTVTGDMTRKQSTADMSRKQSTADVARPGSSLARSRSGSKHSTATADMARPGSSLARAFPLGLRSRSGCTGSRRRLMPTALPSARSGSGGRR
ncbi:hypothetical protein T484DRAFT_1945552 [Baffinella frigidus]|nr:hypothetical protein T484DRAFT_1945552 [Cryptophyta sp. CCMP2293]